MIPHEAYLYLAFFLFSVGLLGLCIRKNLLFILMSLELLLNAANLVFVTGATTHASSGGQITAFFIMTIAAAEAALGLAMVIALFRRYGSVSTDILKQLRG